MCTFSCVITQNEDVIFTSNRDERFNRSIALLPSIYDYHDNEIIYPLDPDGGGTWLAASKNRVVCLLNGSFFPHQARPPYQKSRGKIVLESFGYENPLSFLKYVSLNGIEPFTLIWADLDHRTVWEINWQQQAFLSQYDLFTPKIWASVMLYPEPVRRSRTQNFYQLIDNNQITQEALLDFHSCWNEDPKKSVQINIPGAVATVSISSIVIKQDQLHFLYQDLINSQTNITTLKRDPFPLFKDS